MSDLPGEPDFYDCIVVGSGFGGGVVAARLHKAGKHVLVLERGRSYKPGSFPRAPHQMATNFWDPSLHMYGMFDIWSFRRFTAVVASGVGGGSLIYANVLRRMDPEGFTGWPEGIDRDVLDSRYEKVERDLGGTRYPYVEETAKTRRFRQVALDEGLHWEEATLAITFGTKGDQRGLAFGLPAENLHGMQRSTCTLCGQCDIGCNSGSKNTVDYTYLSKKVGADDVRSIDVKELHEVRSIRPDEGDDGSRGWYVDLDVHSPPDDHWQPPHDAAPPTTRTFRAHRLVLAAGTLGTTYLLLSNRVNLPHLSPRLGSRFSGNGDFLGFITGSRHTLEPACGPVITSMIVGTERRRGQPPRTVGEGEQPVAVGRLQVQSQLPPARRRPQRGDAALEHVRPFRARCRRVPDKLATATGSTWRHDGTARAAARSRRPGHRPASRGRARAPAAGTPSGGGPVR